MKTLFKWIGALSMAGVLSACGGGDDDVVAAPAPAKVGNIAEVAQKKQFHRVAGSSPTKRGLSSTLTSPSANLTVFLHPLIQLLAHWQPS
jgi:hypothetical protein